MSQLITRTFTIWVLGLIIACLLLLATLLIIDPSPEVAFGIGITLGVSIPAWLIAICADWIAHRD